MSNVPEGLRAKASMYALVNTEWRLSIQEFIEHYSAADGSWSALFNDDEGQLLIVSSQDETEESLTVRPLGTYDKEDATWLWAWADDSFSKNLTTDALKVSRYGAENNFNMLCDPECVTPENIAEIFPLMTTYVTQGHKPLIWLEKSATQNICVTVEDDLVLPDLNAETCAKVLSAATAYPESIIDFRSAFKHYAAQRGFSANKVRANTWQVRFADGSETTIRFKDNQPVEITY